MGRREEEEEKEEGRAGQMRKLEKKFPIYSALRSLNLRLSRLLRRKVKTLNKFAREGEYKWENKLVALLICVANLRNAGGCRQEGAVGKKKQVSPSLEI
eukprot:370521-Hanusia_phi.AAC.2